MNLDYNKQDAIPKPISSTTVASSEYNQIAGSLMHTQNTAGLTADANDLTQITTAINKLGATAAMPSSVYDDLTLGASGSTYTAPANGFVAFSKYATGATQNVRISCNNFDSLSWSHTGSINIFTWMPVKKGDVFTITYSAAGTETSNYFRFIYAEGSKQEAN